MRKILNIVSITAVSVIILFLGLVTVTKHFGVYPYTYSDGALIYVLEADVSAIKPGDKVTFYLNQQGDIATCKVHHLDYDAGLFYVDRADLSFGNNPTGITYVPFNSESIIGKTLVTVPFAGNVVDFISTRMGFGVMIGSAMVLLVIVFLTLQPGQPKEKPSPKQAEPQEQITDGESQEPRRRRQPPDGKKR
ncbi:MAG: hypothetical protein J6L92_04760 [Clostridia bacterium]|nr:hypothetical protein [Clostridia bacterium]